MQKIRIGTRGSKLAICQAEAVKKEITKAFKNIVCEIVIIQTKGDIILDVALSKIGDKGIFTKEIEIALLNNNIDIAVHSLKDLPTVLPEGLKLNAVLKRDEVRDVFVSNYFNSIDDLTFNNTVGTSSLRRKALTNIKKPKIKIKDIRGNIETRLSKLNNGYCDGIIIAGAALERLNMIEKVKEFLNPEEFIPAASQGIIAIESKIGNNYADEICEAINHKQTFNIGNAEREYLKLMQGGCQVPIGCYTRVDNEKVVFIGFVSKIDGKQYIKIREEGILKNINNIAISVANKIINNGGKNIIDDIYSIINE